MTGKVGVAISTYKRPRVLAQALQGWALAEIPDVLVVNHDVEGVGVAVTKNAGIAALMDAGCDHLFLADDDCWPLRSHWWSPYVRSQESHLCHCWGQTRFHREDPGLGVSVWNWPRGVLLYVERKVIERVGGMRTEFKNAGEHAEFSRRIHNCGFTTYEFQDVVEAGLGSGWWACCDYTRSVPSTLPADRYGPAETRRRKALYDRFRHSDEYVEYR